MPDFTGTPTLPPTTTFTAMPDFLERAQPDSLQGSHDRRDPNLQPDHPSHPVRSHPLPIRRALLSVSDKSGLVPFADFLHSRGIALISTGGTSTTLRQAGIPVTDVSEITGFPEMMDGRVKTLHPRIHAGILERRDLEADQTALQEHSILPIDLVVVNLYPFKQANKEGDLPLQKAIEFIDIGGPSMIRAAAKNLHSKAVACDPDQYASIMEELTLHGDLSLETREALAGAAFTHTADYDAAISAYFGRRKDEAGSASLPSHLQLSFPASQTLRYGENPHQNAAVYGEQTRYIDCFHGKELSYNNYLDLDAALRLLSDFRDAQPTAAIFKHTVPCGVASSHSLADAWSLAYATDRTSPFGGILAFNRPLDVQTARLIDEIFSEIVVAPDFDADALSLLQQKKNRRLVRLLQYPDDALQMTSIFGGILAQQRDAGNAAATGANGAVTAATGAPTTSATETTSSTGGPAHTAESTAAGSAGWTCVTQRVPTQEEWKALRFAWTVVRHVKSNAIVFTDASRTLGIGNGQTSRVDSSEIAIRKAHKEGLNLEGSVVASDAFFPFPDGVEEAAAAGATAVIQPGGSVRDEEVIQTANRLGLAMIFTGRRHFRH